MTNFDIWDRLQSINHKRVAIYLRNEYPQTVAVVLSHFSHKNAAKVLAALPTSFAIEVAMRISKLGSVSPRIMKILTDSMLEDLPSVSQPQLGGVDFLCQVCNELQGSTRGIFVEALQERSSMFADKFKNRNLNVK